MDIQVFIEISADSSVKYEIDHHSGSLMVDRFLHTAMYFPFNYGYIDHTLGEDNDPLDVLVLSSHSIMPGASLKCHPIGLLEMTDEAGVDTKVIAVPDAKIDPLYGHLDDINQVEQSLKEKIKHFFEHYKELEKGKWVKVRSWLNQNAAEKEVQKARQRLNK